MATFTLLTLRLHAPLPYRGFENPPFSGLNSPGKGGRGETDDAATADFQAIEGSEELFVFDEVDFVGFDPDEGPFAAARLPAPRFHGRGLPGPEARAAGEALYTLPSGDYLFLQWRPSGEDEVREGIEFFCREAWWEGQVAQGPFLLRRVFEDGAIATQLLRSLASPAS